MTKPRKLPLRFNHLLTESNPSKDDLVDLRRLGQTKLTTNNKPSPVAGSSSVPQQVLFSYVHLRAPLPNDINPEIFGGTNNGPKPEAYFLMRRSKDGYVSSTGMFKASFPYATKQEEESERRVVKSRFEISPDETAGNAWISPDDALTLSHEYQCRVWIEALLDDRPVTSDRHNKAITPPPLYKPINGNVEPLSPASMKDAPATSPIIPPRKIAPMRKPRSVKATMNSKESPMAVNPPDQSSPLVPALASSSCNPALSSNEQTADTTTITATTIETSVVMVKKEDSAEDSGVGQSDHVLDAAAHPKPSDSDIKGEVEVETTTETKGDSIVESTHIKLELPPTDDTLSLFPETPDKLIAKAKEMVADATKETPELVPTKKRKIEDSSSQDIPDIGDLEISSPKKSKRVRMMDVLAEEKFQKRALIGIGATVALGGLAFFSNLI